MPRVNDEKSNHLLNCKPAPDTCPICHQGIVPTQIGQNLIRNEHEQIVLIELLYRCPKHKCHHAFVAYYRQNVQNRRLDGDFKLRDTQPYQIENELKSEEIANLSPSYVDIFRQSRAAEHYGLMMIAGCGYRKALEFLIKDYLISKRPEEKENIEKLLLGRCINEYVDDSKLNKCAKKAAWLGNDEVHYMRKWEDRDIQDLKILMQLTETWIESNLLTEKYEKNMNKRK